MICYRKSLRKAKRAQVTKINQYYNHQKGLNLLICQHNEGNRSKTEDLHKDRVAEKDQDSQVTQFLQVRKINRRITFRYQFHHLSEQDKANNTKNFEIK